MTTPIEKLVAIQYEIKAVSAKLGQINDQLKNHPSKPFPGASGYQIAYWNELSRTIAKPKPALVRKFNELCVERDTLKQEMYSEGIPTVTFGHIIDSLLDIECEFETGTSNRAWDKVSALIDWMEKEHTNLKEATSGSAA